VNKDSPSEVKKMEAQKGIMEQPKELPMVDLRYKQHYELMSAEHINPEISKLPKGEILNLWAGKHGEAEYVQQRVDNFNIVRVTEHDGTQSFVYCPSTWKYHLEQLIATHVGKRYAKLVNDRLPSEKADLWGLYNAMTWVA